MEHAKLSPSSAHRWLTCTPSAKLEQAFPNESSEYALEGVLAHSFGEMKLRAFFKGERVNFDPLRESKLYTPEIDTCSDLYVDYVKTIFNRYAEPPSVLFEQRYDLREVVPEGFGTADCTIICGGDLHVVDYKHGKGVFVSAEDNPQLRLYALGAYHAFRDLYDITRVFIHIVQPRLDNFSEETLSTEELLGWAEYAKLQAGKASRGEGSFEVGEHCRFCRARAACRARADFYSALADFGEKKPPLLTDEEVGKILMQSRSLAKWIDDLQEYALAQCLAGKDIAGWKVVAGRSARKFTDAQKALDKLVELGYSEAMLYERKPLTLAAIEKVIGKKPFTEAVGDLIITPQGAPTLAPADDKRQAYQKSSAEDDFSAEEQG